MGNPKHSLVKLGSKPAKALRSPNSSEIQKSLAASVLSQTNSNKETGKEMETFASKVLTSTKYNKDTKSFAASLVSQSNKER